MIVNLDLDAMKCTVTREPSDPKLYGRQNAAGESKLLYAVKNELAAQGYDLVKKRMYKDGHMVDEYQQYLRSRDTNQDVVLAIFSPFFALRDANTDYNAGEVVLAVANIGRGA